LIQEGTAIVVSPLIALMKTKLMPGVYLQKEGIAHVLNHSQNGDSQKKTSLPTN
jgi:superfamily II DNA helicase RecQ